MLDYQQEKYLCRGDASVLDQPKAYQKRNRFMYVPVYLSLLLLVIISSACANASSISIDNSDSTFLRPVATKQAHTPTQSVKSITLYLPHQPALARRSIQPPAKKPTPVATSQPTVVLQPTSQPVQSPVTGGAQTASEQQLVQQLFARINQDRANAGLTPLTWNTILAGTAYQHSTLMLQGCGIAHQCAGEAAPCQRIAAAGLNDPACGENIGNAAATPTLWAGVQQIDIDMLNEPAPALHRRNILSTTHHSLGIGIRISSTNQTWITEDFSDL
jgi:Uncharacterized protein with SCP/PR1 domains